MSNLCCERGCSVELSFDIFKSNVHGTRFFKISEVQDTRLKTEVFLSFLWKAVECVRLSSD